MGDVRRPDLRERVLAVVRLVGKADAALEHLDDVAVGVPVVAVDVGVDEAADSRPLQPSDQADQLGRVGHRCDRREVVAERIGTEPLDLGLVHEAGEDVAELLRIRPGLGVAGVGAVGGVTEDVGRIALGVEHEIDEVAGRREVGGDLGRRQPRAVDVPEQVVLGPDRRVDSRHAGDRRSARPARLVAHRSAFRVVGSGHRDPISASQRPCTA